MFPIDDIAKVLKLLGDSNRLSIILALEDDAKSVSQLLQITRLSQPLVSFHLRVLREAGLIVTERKGTMVFNSLSDPELPKLLKQFAKYGVSAKTDSANFPFCCPPWMKRRD